MSKTDDIIAACKAEWPKHQNDCGGFAKAVATRLGIPLTGLANDIVDHIRGGPGARSPMGRPRSRRWKRANW